MLKEIAKQVGKFTNPQLNEIEIVEKIRGLADSSTLLHCLLREQFLLHCLETNERLQIKYLLKQYSGQNAKDFEDYAFYGSFVDPQTQINFDSGTVIKKGVMIQILEKYELYKTLNKYCLYIVTIDREISANYKGKRKLEKVSLDEVNECLYDEWDEKYS